MNRDQLREQSEAFAREHLAECAKDLLEWQDTGLLPSGKVRELVQRCEAWAGRDALPVARAMVERAALQHAASA